MILKTSLEPTNYLHTIIIFIMLIMKITSASPKLSSCLPKSCGNGPNISYPFWILEEHEPHCGSPEFNVTCHGKYPILRISNDDYIVKNIDYANNSVLLANAEVLDEENSCPTPLHNFSISGMPFSYGSNFTELHFFYNCTFSDKTATYLLDCASNASHHSFALFHGELLKKQNFSVESCQATVTTPVSTAPITLLLQMNYTDVLRAGFVLAWNGADCGNCLKSGGECGSLNDEFVCVCDGKPRSRTCDGKRKVAMKIGIALGSAVFGVAFTVFAFFIYAHRRKAKAGSSFLSSSSHPSSVSDSDKGGTYKGVPVFTFSELEKATNNFDSKKEIGDGGFGTVYKGKLQDGRVVAVKRLYENNFKRVEQFMNEIEILTRLRHKNLVPLYGCTSLQGRQLLLVYEYIPNGTIADHLHGARAKPGKPTWRTRMSIALETASALSYLHASDVIHRDVKTTNILLDNNFSVKVADFGLSRLFPLDVTHVSTAPQGTPGYVDPEYHECYQLTDKSDVYSFGVVLIELISSKPAVDITRHRHEINLSNMAINKIQNDALNELVDPNLGFESDREVQNMIAEVAELAFRCLQNGKELRPTMQEVLEVLEGIEKNYYGNKNQVRIAVDHSAGDALLWKKNSENHSPDSVTVKWVSVSTMSTSST